MSKYKSVTCEIEELKGYNTLTRNFLYNRGIVTKEEAEKFLYPDFERDLHDPFVFKDMQKAIDRIYLAIKREENILIYTDYDCDGIPANVILSDFFDKINYKNVESYIPHRHKEGYGLHVKALEEFVKKDYKLVITADLGITNNKEVDYLQESGVDIILTDHHLPLHVDGVESLPQSFALINCRVSHEIYPNKYICGAATAWKLVHAFLMKHGEEFGVVKGWEKWLLDMVAVATVADMMELKGENRALVTYGLKVLQKSQRAGLQKMLAYGRAKQAELSEIDISFVIAPRINAAGRIDHPIKSYKAMYEKGVKGEAFANEVEMYNNLRKKSVEDISKIAFAGDAEGDFVFMGNADWPIGVVGLIAQKLRESTGKTVFVWGEDEEGMIRGSSRSGDDNLNVTDFAASAREFLAHFGGHEGAGGFALVKDNIENFKKTLKKNYKKLKKEAEQNQKDKNNNQKDKEVAIDYEVSGADINFALYKELRNLAPFGIGNPAPIISVFGNIDKIRKFGKTTNNLEFFINGLNCVIFGWKEEDIQRLKDSKNVIGNLELDNFSKKLRLKVLDIL